MNITNNLYRKKELNEYAKALYYTNDLKYIYNVLKKYCKINNTGLMDKCKFKDFYDMIEPMISNDIPNEFKEYSQFKISK